MRKSSGTTVIVREDEYSLEIEIAAPRIWVAIIFTTIWLVGWLLSELLVLAVLYVNSPNNDGASTGTFIWLAFWTLAGVLTVHDLIWLLTAKEMIAIRNGQLSIRKRQMYSSIRVYDINFVYNIRVNDRLSAYSSIITAQNGSLGTILFDYNERTINLGYGLSPQDALVLADKIRSRIN